MEIRPRRNRSSETIRSLIRENQVTLSDLVYPMFVKDGKNIKEEIPTLKGNYRFSIDELLQEIESCVDLGLRTFMLFPAVEESLKDSFASYSYHSDNFYLKAATAIKKAFPEVCLISDVAMDPYSTDGHDGLVKDGRILNDETLPILAQMSVAQARAGFDIIGPSDMMDGRILYIRKALDEAGFTDTGIMSYTVKYASAFYGPFRDALNSAPKFGDKKTYQMDPANSREAFREAQLDADEGADFLMVKPAVHYLDVIQTLKQNFDLPIAAYHVSGEYALLKSGAEQGLLDLETAVKETLICLKRAGCDIIITYFAKQYAQWGKNNLG
ncbi:porphobilinogen synthase [Membranihabitans marinus]|uniref:porphobilinogen synthase n=1 Tax=Membranihabitans marinus TaxID=1227546 RepID=UPI001F003726|nr:porphobilinogen synthase [Membranihabitans marinus]